MRLYRWLGRKIIDRLYLSFVARMRSEVQGNSVSDGNGSKSGPWGGYRTAADGRPRADVISTLQNEIALLRWNVKVLAAAIGRGQPLGATPQEAPLAAPMRVGLTSRLCRQADIESAWMQYWCSRLQVGSVYHRKFWEWGYVLQALWEAGMIAPGRRGLAFAAGREPLPAFLVGQGLEILASDLHSGDERTKAWHDSNQHSSDLDALFYPSFVTRDVFDAKCSFRFVDMNAIPADFDGKFDFCWSVCAAEHVGAIDLSLRFLENSVQCLKPGGIAVHTIEFNLDGGAETLDNWPTILLRREHIEALRLRLAAKGHELIEVDYDAGSGALDGFVDPQPYMLPAGALLRYPDVPHLRLSVDQFPATSIGIIIRAAGAAKELPQPDGGRVAGLNGPVIGGATPAVAVVKPTDRNGRSSGLPTPLATADDPLKPIFTQVIGRSPIELIAYYPALVDYYPECELQTKRWCVDHVGPDWTIFDVGANIGYYSILFSQLAPRGTVFAFEPTETVGMLRSNLVHHHCDNVQIHETALGMKSGWLEDAIFRMWGQEPERRRYRFSTVDQVVKEVDLRRLDLIKIDVDSFDLEVLRGAEETLDRYNPWVVVELNHALEKRGQSVGEALEWLASRCYTDALVLDHENFLLRRTAGRPSDTVLPSLRLTFDLHPLILPSALGKGAPLHGCLAPVPTQHGDGVAAGEDRGVWAIHAPGPRWAYAATWPCRFPQDIRSAVIELRVDVRGGTIGIGCVGDDFSTYVGKELTVSPGEGTEYISLAVEDARRCAYLVVRNADPDGGAASVTLLSIHCFVGIPSAGAVYNGVLAGNKRRLALEECQQALRGVAISPETAETAEPGIDIVPVEELGAALNVRHPFVPEVQLYRHDLAEFQTQRDEAAIFRYIYKAIRPRRHLEFGTWEGFGALLCAQSCDAEIWTIDLPGGERDAAGNAMYEMSDHAASADHRQEQATDTEPFNRAIGWRYRTGGYAARVHQILCDSRQFDVGQFSPGFFDTILVDGGHQPDIVTNDTNKALPLLRSQGLMIWHDFCPDPSALASMAAPRGVVTSFVENFLTWNRHFSRIFWIQPSWILVGIKA